MVMLQQNVRFRAPALPVEAGDEAGEGAAVDAEACCDGGAALASRYRGADFALKAVKLELGRRRGASGGTSEAHPLGTSSRESLAGALRDEVALYFGRQAEGKGQIGRAHV